MESLNDNWGVFFSKLDKVKQTRNGIEALCPSHNDKNPSPTIINRTEAYRAQSTDQRNRTLLRVPWRRFGPGDSLRPRTRRQPYELVAAGGRILRRISLHHLRPPGLGGLHRRARLSAARELHRRPDRTFGLPQGRQDVLGGPVDGRF